ncbi:MAG TPA: hypothetical protein VFG50_15995 [Rhodothermales bacterium]|nr:hypothetical protein [Rhodothermales bacterium]
MPQSLLAILAITVLATFALTQHRNRLYMQEVAIRNEISTQALAVATDRLEEMGRMAFDEHTVGSEGGMAKLTSVDLLTPVDSFGTDGQSNDIDDYNGVSIDTFRVTAGAQVWFRLKTEVKYANETNPDQVVDYKTRIKKATVWAYPVDTLGINVPGGIQAPDTIRLSQAYACGSWCDW